MRANDGDIVAVNGTPAQNGLAMPPLGSGVWRPGGVARPYAGFAAAKSDLLAKSGSREKRVRVRRKRCATSATLGAGFSMRTAIRMLRTSSRSIRGWIGVYPLTVSFVGKLVRGLGRKSKLGTCLGLRLQGLPGADWPPVQSGSSSAVDSSLSRVNSLDSRCVFAREIFVRGLKKVASA